MAKTKTISIGEQIENELKIVNTTVIPINPNYAQTYDDLIELISLYLNSKYRGKDEDSEGFKRWFLNISDYRCKTASKSIDIDTKDITLMAEPGQSYMPVWFLSKELKTYMKETHWAKLFNDIKTELPRWGSVVVKKAGDGSVDLVNLINFRPFPTAKNLKLSPFIIEEHPYSIDEFEEEASRLGWDHVSEIIDLHKDDSEIIVHERHGRWGKKLNRAIVSKKKDKEFVLGQDDVDEIPYKELHYDKRQGRWVAKGMIEDLFENQIASNETVNFKRKNMYWGSKYLFQTEDDTVAAKMLTDMVSGRVLQSKKAINRIDMREQNLSVYQTEENTWDKNADNKTFAHDIMRGVEMKAGTPLGLGRLQAGMAASYYEGIKENYAIFLKDILFEWVLPDFKKKNNKKHVLNFTGDSSEMEKFDKLQINAKLNNEVMKYVFEKKKVPDATQVNIIRGIIAEKQTFNDRSVDLPKGFYDNLKIKMDIDIVGESVDSGGRIQALQYALGLIASNPMILQNPQTKKVFFKILNLAGISPTDFEAEVDMPNLMETITKQMGGGKTPTPRVPTSAVAPAA